MTFVTVFRRVPRPITGMIGILQDPDFERFGGNLDWLETTGVLVEQFVSAGSTHPITRGRATVTCSPISAGGVSSRIVPRCRSRIRCTIDSPSPLPGARVPGAR